MRRATIALIVLILVAVGVLGFFVVRSAVGYGGSATATVASTGTSTSHGAGSVPGGPEIKGRSKLASALRALDAHGSLWVFDAECRRSILRLPGLHWTALGTVSVPDCKGGPSLASDSKYGLTASAKHGHIDVSAESWHYSFSGTEPSFKPSGTLTFIRDGQLYQWGTHCPPDAKEVVFHGSQSVKRCQRAVKDAPSPLVQIVWLRGPDYAAIVGKKGAQSVLVFVGGRKRTIFKSGKPLSDLEASPAGRYLSVNAGGRLALLDTRSGPVKSSVTEDLAAVTWSRDDSFTASTNGTSVTVFPSSDPGQAVTIPVAAAALRWH